MLQYQLTCSTVLTSLPSLTQLAYLIAALEHGSWTKASQAVGVSASAFGQGISELERRLGVVLFTKEGRTRVPTAEAHNAAIYARSALGELESLDRWADQVRTGESGSIKAGMIDTAAVHHFGETLVRFRALHPKISVQLDVRPSAVLFDRLRAGELDVIVAVAPDDTDGLSLIKLVTEPLYVYAPPATKVGHPETWGPWVGFPSGSRTRALATQALRKRGADVSIVAESSQPAVLCEMVRLGMGWTVLSATDAEREPHQLKRATKTPIAKRVLTLAQREDRPATEALLRFVSMLVGGAPK